MKTRETILNERADAILNGILSINNGCIRLEKLLSDPAEFKRIAMPLVLPTLQVCMSETQTQFTDALRQSNEKEAMRFALESIVANMAIPEGPVKDALRNALPGHPHLA